MHFRWMNVGDKMKYQIRTVAVFLFATLSFTSIASASRCMKSAEKQAVSLLKKSGHSESSRTKNTFLVKNDEEIRRVYKLSELEELYSTEVWEEEGSFAVYDVLVEGETCRLKMVRAGGI